MQHATLGGLTVSRIGLGAMSMAGTYTSGGRLDDESVRTIRRAHAVHPVAALQTEYSLSTRHVEAELLPLLHDLATVDR